jgi:putative ABC transport system permease protein
VRRIELLRVALTGLLRNKMRSLLTMLGVIIGVAAVIVMVSISAGTEATIEEQITGLGTNLVFVGAAKAAAWSMLMLTPSLTKLLGCRPLSSNSPPARR